MIKITLAILLFLTGTVMASNGQMDDESFKQALEFIGYDISSLHTVPDAYEMAGNMGLEITVLSHYGVIGNRDNTTFIIWNNGSQTYTDNLGRLYIGGKDDIGEEAVL